MTPGSMSQGSATSGLTNLICKKYGKNYKGECMTTINNLGLIGQNIG